MSFELTINDYGDFTTDSTFTTAIIISLFTDRRAKEEDPLPDPESSDRRGWWADNLAEVQDDRIGSRLWLLSREKTIQSALTRAKQYTKEALQWLIEDGLAAEVEVKTERILRGNEPTGDTLAIQVRVYKVTGIIESYTFQTLWSEL